MFGQVYAENTLPLHLVSVTHKFFSKPKKTQNLTVKVHQSTILRARFWNHQSPQIPFTMNYDGSEEEITAQR